MIDNAILKRLEAISGSDLQLPTERALAEEFGVTRHAIRKALDRLERDGRLWRHVGRGTFAGKRPVSSHVDLGAVGRISSPREIIEVRQMIEPQIAAAAALRASADQIASLETAMQRSAAARSMDDYEAWDELFHRTIVEAAGNPLLAHIYNLVNQARMDVVWTTLKRTMFEPETRAQFAAQHARIVTGIVTRNSDDTWAAMRDHMTTIADVYLALENRQIAGVRSSL